MRIEIVVDDQDREACPDSPLTMTAWTAPAASQDGFAEMVGEAVLGSDIPTMLRELADNWKEEN